MRRELVLRVVLLMAAGLMLTAILDLRWSQSTAISPALVGAWLSEAGRNPGQPPGVDVHPNLTGEVRVGLWGFVGCVQARGSSQEPLCITRRFVRTVRTDDALLAAGAGASLMGLLFSVMLVAMALLGGSRRSHLARLLLLGVLATGGAGLVSSVLFSWFGFGPSGTTPRMGILPALGVTRLGVGPLLFAAGWLVGTAGGIVATITARRREAGTA